ncbi:MAG: tryptophan synthase subunit alpha [archaeon]|nr:tryptophan synthase subunit alpha [archaeon]
MSRFADRFKELEEKGEAAFIPFVVLGDPDFETSFEIIKTLIKNGADALELGFAFSDPIADGKTVQEADQRALAAGMDTDKALSLIKKIRAFNKEIPISLLVYYNLILQRGIEKFYSNAKSAGVDAVLAADCPVEEAQPLLKAAKKSEIDQVFIVAPTTTESRLKKILETANGYIYLVSTLGVTGERTSLQNRTIELIKRVKPHSKLPICVGFGISTPEHIKGIILAGADGAIVGSAIINLIKKNAGNTKAILKSVSSFCVELKKATRP